MTRMIEVDRDKLIYILQDIQDACKKLSQIKEQYEEDKQLVSQLDEAKSYLFASIDKCKGSIT